VGTVDFNDRLILGDGFIVLLGVFMKRGEVHAPINVARVQFDRAVNRLNRFAALAELIVGESEILPAQGVARFEAYGLVVFGYRVLVTFGLEVGKRKVRLGLEITGLAAYHFAKYGDRLAVSAVAEASRYLGT